MEAEFRVLGQEEKEALKREIAAMIHVAMPGIVVSFDPAFRTACIQPAAAGRIGGKPARMPMLRDVPVFSPGEAAMEIQPGDECLVVFADGCIDGWFESGSDTLPPSERMHDLSDGFAFVGFHSGRRAAE